MGSNRKYTFEQKVNACEDYLSGKKSAITIAKELSMGKNGYQYVLEWVNSYRVNGAKIFERRTKYPSYSKELKEKVVKEYLNGEGSLHYLADKYSIIYTSTIRKWIKKYNNHIELEDYKISTEVYMADTLKASKQEKIEIVKWCLDHNRDIKLTASHFKGNYAQIYQWVKKYELNGEDGLDDRRGKRKQESELTEVEILQRKLKQSEAEKEEFRKKYELLKKAEQVERW